MKSRNMIPTSTSGVSIYLAALVHSVRRQLIHFFSLLVRVRFWILLLAHALVFGGCFVAAYVIRFESIHVPRPFFEQMYATVGWVIAIKLVCFYTFRSFHGRWRYVTFADLKLLGQASLVSLIVITLFDHFVLTLNQIPRSVVVIDALLTFMALGTIRSSWRMLQEEIKPRLSKEPKTNDSGGSQQATWKLAHQLRSLPDLRYNIIGLVSTPNCDTHRWMASLPVLGDLDSLELVLSGYTVQDPGACGELSSAEMRRLSEVAKESDKRLRVIPASRMCCLAAARFLYATWKSTTCCARVGGAG